MVFQNNLLMGAAGQSAEAYTIDQSCRFNDNDSAHLHWTPSGAASDSKKLTISLWAKRANIGTGVVSGPNGIASMVGCAASGIFMGFLRATDTWGVVDGIRFGYTDGSQLYNTTQSFRDPGAWYHFVMQIDSTQSTEADRFTLWVNGEEVTAFKATDFTNLSEDDSLTKWGVQSIKQSVGTGGTAQGDLFDGYLAEVIFVDGTAYAASKFGETNSTTGQWIPKLPSGITFGNNGYHLDFADSSSLGNDVSGNDNDFTASGLAAADQTPDSPTLNRAVLNAAQDGSSATAVMSEGNTRVAVSGSTRIQRMSTIPLVGKVYWEVAVADNSQNIAGICDNTVFPMEYNDFQELLPPHVMVYDNANLWYNDSYDTYSQPSNGQRWMFAYDADTGELWGGVNGTWHNSGDPAAGTGEVGTVGTTTTWFIVIGGKSGADQQLILGSDNMSHTVPSGFTADLNVSQLDDPTIADPSDYFNVDIYTGTGESLARTGIGFQPNLLIDKSRSNSDSFDVVDSVRGVDKYLYTDGTAAEETDTDKVQSFDSDGYTLGTGGGINSSGRTYVAWLWKESTTPAFDIVSYDGTGSVKTESHGLGVVPDLMIIKNRDEADGWVIYHQSLGATQELRFSSTVPSPNSVFFNDTAPTSSVFTVGTSHGVNGPDEAMIAYVFAEVEGFSKISSYVGNGNADGPFVWCGFRPSFLLWKSVSNADDWNILDDQRSPYNVADLALEPNTNDAEVTGSPREVDLLSNGFKIRGSDTNLNGNGHTLIFWACADTPFKTALAR